MKNIQQAFRDFIVKENLFNTSHRLLIAVSGGVDSVVLCHLCFNCGFDFHVAHCNFNLRGLESEEDARFVQALAAKLHVPYLEISFDTEMYAAEKKVSIQVAARELRYSWFADLLAGKDGRAFDYLLTAHHADDNAETVLMNFFKGTGIAGLKGIMPAHGKIVRPLLFAEKAQLLQYATDYNLLYREDSSNASEKYTRNFFRNKLIPAVENIFPSFKENLAANATRFRDIQILYNQAVAGHIKKLVVKKGGEVHIPVLRLLNTPALTTVTFEIIKDYGFTAAQVKDVLNLLRSETGKFVNSGSHRIFRYNKWLVIYPLGSSHTGSFLIGKDDTEIAAGNFLLHFSHITMPVPIETNLNVAMLDAKHIIYPLVLRNWKQGDYFYPLGMRKKKKVGRFLSDEKTLLSEKENTWVIESGKKIIWVVGRRIDDRFKITDQTKILLKINRLPSK